jgi:glycosyltransferase involved in cell wall biosynthesis
VRITADLTPAVHSHAGIGRYTQELFTALTTLDSTNSYAAFYSAPAGNEKPAPPLDRLPARITRLTAKPLRLSVMLTHFAGLSLDHWLPPTDIFHATDHVLLPLRRARSVFTLYDLTVRLSPASHLPLNRWYSTLMLPVFMHRATAIIAISEQTRRDAVQWLPALASKIRVIYPGVNARFRPVREPEPLARVRAKYALPPAFVLYVGTLEPRKNIPALLEAYRALLSSLPSAPPLVLAGRKGWLYEPIFRKLTELGLESKVHFTDWIADDDLPALLSSARLFVYPSLYEGFGLPPLEAMACGTPVVCSNTSSLPEVVGQSGLLVDPHDGTGLAEAMRRLLTEPELHAELSARGRAQAQGFTWERTARETLKLYAQLF